jgi:peptidoglycan/xylan/chitin deacetylase (PgdA/CDA1 family)
MSKRIIRNIIGQDPVCFRAPYLAIDGKTLRILEREGFLLDSSLYNSAFGRLSYPYHPSEVDPSSEGKIKLWEVPVTISPLPRKKLVYWRYPGILELEEREIEKTVYLLERIFLQCKLPFALFVILIHPYDLGSPKIISRLSYFLALMKDMKAVSLTASQLIKKLTINVGKNVCV